VKGSYGEEKQCMQCSGGQAFKVRGQFEDKAGD